MQAIRKHANYFVHLYGLDGIINMDTFDLLNTLLPKHVCEYPNCTKCDVEIKSELKLNVNDSYSCEYVN